MVLNPLCSDLSQVGGNWNSKGSENLDIFMCMHVLCVCVCARARACVHKTQSYPSVSLRYYWGCCPLLRPTWGCFCEIDLPAFAAEGKKPEKNHGSYSILGLLVLLLVLLSHQGL